MKLIIGLGNPGAKYDNTRHNAGFMALDTYAQQQGVSFTLKSKFSAHLGEFSLSGEKILLAKPTTYYNDSGLSARALMDFYKLALDDILVVHDDSMLDFGKVRIRRGGQAAGNNGLKSLHQHIGDNFWHIRIGTDSLLHRQVSDTDFVLGKFNSDETKVLSEWTIPTVATVIEQFIVGQIEPTSYKL